MTDEPLRDPSREAPYHPVPVIDAVAFDSADPVRLGQFWQSLLGGELRGDQHDVIELHGGRVRLDFARVPDWQVMRDPEGNEFCFVWGAG
jgi:hypothetical protein